MVTIQNKDVLGALMALRKLDQVKLSAATSLKLVKLNKVLTAHWEDIDTVRKQVIKDAAKLDEEGNALPEKEDGSVEIDPAKKEEAEAALQSMFDKTFDVDDKLVLNVSDFGTTPLEPAIFLGLGDLVTE